ncbi:MAG: PhzF family phenazine biosynthesis isomerase, partial [Pseudorhodobacter sp.]
MVVERIAAFSMGKAGGNPAGVVLAEALPAPAQMQRIAREVGYSETVFAARQGDGWQARYFAPEGEVPFCGHATIALGVVLGERFGAGRYDLALSKAEISVEAEAGPEGWRAVLSSPPTRSWAMAPLALARLLALFGLKESDLDPRFLPLVAHGGADHAVLALRERGVLAAMGYDFEAGRALMAEEGWTTISLIQFAEPGLVHARNAFAIGGVVEDAATGAAAAALAGALVDRGWWGLERGGRFRILQGEDMGSPSEL